MRTSIRIAAVVAFASSVSLGACAGSETATPTAPSLTLATEPSAARTSDNAPPQERAVLGAMEEYKQAVLDSDVKAIAETPASEDEPRISPDGKWVAFTTDESGTTQVVVQAFPGPGTKIQVSTNGGNEPLWSRDGRRLFYRGSQKIVAAELITAPALAVKSRIPLFDDVFLPATERHANYDISPDGTRFLLLKSVGEERLIVARNWDEELRTRLLRSRNSP